MGLLLAGTSPSAPIEQIVATVDKTIITQTELMNETRVSLLLREGERGLSIANGKLKSSLLTSTLDYLINQHLISSHIRRLGKSDVPGDIIDDRFKQLWGIFPSVLAFKAFGKRHGISSQTFRTILRREIMNELYVQERMRGWLSSARVGQDQNEVAKKALERWVNDLRKSSVIKVIDTNGDLRVVRPFRE